MSLYGLCLVANCCVGKAGTQASRRSLANVVSLVDFVLTASSLAVGLGIIFGIAALADVGIIDAVKLKMVLSTVCPLVTMSQFVSPIPTVLEALRKLDARNLPLPVFKSQSACNIISMAYGIRIQNKVVLGANLFGLGCQVLYLSSNHYVIEGNGKWMGYVLRLQVIYCLGLYVCTEVLSLDVLGQIITVFNLVLFAAPLSQLGNILKTRNATALPTAMTVISCVNNAVWSLYAILIKDMVVLLPSVLGFLLCLFQVLVLLWGFHVLPFDLSFILIPCKSTPAVSTKSVEEDEALHEDKSNPELTPVTPSALARGSAPFNLDEI